MYWSVWVGFQYTQVSSVLSDHAVTKVPKNGMDPLLLGISLVQMWREPSHHNIVVTSLSVIVLHMDLVISPFMCDNVTDLSIFMSLFSIFMGLLSKVQTFFV